MYSSLELGMLLKRSYYFIITDKARIKRPSKLKFMVASSAPTVINRVLNFWSGHKFNRVGKTTDFGDKYGKVLGGRLHSPTKFFGSPPSTMKWFINKCWTEFNSGFVLALLLPMFT